MLKKLIAEPGWDKPFLKKLSKIDAGKASSNLAGLVIPWELTKIYPSLLLQATPVNPTKDKHILANYVVDLQ